MSIVRSWLMLVSLMLASTALAEVTGKIVKVLPHLLDAQGRHAVSPSLFDRDAYQFHLRTHPELASGIRYDIQWKAKRARDAALRVRLELLTTRSTKAQPLVFEQPVRAKAGTARWAKIPIVGTDYERAGDIIAWRVTLWDADTLVAEQKSFLW